MGLDGGDGGADEVFDGGVGERGWWVGGVFVEGSEGEVAVGDWGPGGVGGGGWAFVIAGTDGYG